MRMSWLAAVVLGGCAAVHLPVQCQGYLAPVSNREACQRIKTQLPLVESVKEGRSTEKVTGTQMTPTGFVLSRTKGPDVAVEYRDFINYPPAGFFGGHVYVELVLPGKIYDLNFSTKQGTAGPNQMVGAIFHLALPAKNGRGVDCVSPPPDYAAELAAFTQQTAAWRALPSKPALSEDVTKKRLLAEDAVANKNLNAAVSYYNAGLALDPTWAAGWFDVALLYAEQNDFEHAAFSMKHYLILLPNASDAPAAKDREMLWEAKAEEASSSTTQAPANTPPPKPSAKRSMMQGMWPGMQPK